MAAVRHLGLVICVWITYKEYLEFFIVVLNVVRIGALVLIIHQFQYFANLA